MANILVAEDEPDIRELVSFILHYAGHAVITANNGEEAVQLAGQNVPDLILMDVRMPRMTGYDACKAIKSNPLISHVPIVFLSAKGQESEVQTGMLVGAEAYLLKPFAPDQLTEKIEAILRKYGKASQRGNAAGGFR